jgi:hypothetical protein
MSQSGETRPLTIRQIRKKKKKALDPVLRRKVKVKS